MRRVLVAEDSELQRSLTGTILRPAGYEVQIAADGREALKLWNSASFDLVITDIVMPNVDGLELIREIRRQQSRVKIVAISGGGQVKSEQYLGVAGKMGADYCLPKPFTLGAMLETIAQALFPYPTPSGPEFPRA